MADDFKYHIDHHVGLVPPPALLAARSAHSRGELDSAGLRAAEDVAIRRVLQMQRRLGLVALGDGQYRRRHPLSVVYDNIDGFSATPETGGRVAELLGDRLAPERRALKATFSYGTRM
jgi:5-methyltetrahydropteroyltriglutamate--homocysteine methyltransferase